MNILNLQLKRGQGFFLPSSRMHQERAATKSAQLCCTKFEHRIVSLISEE
ncbi:MAG: hypothetical protein WDM70_04870 [Nitrosomonadales bacterium]